MKKYIFILISAIFLFFPIVAWADLGPKPGMTFHLKPAIDLMVSIKDGQQIECDDSACTNGKPLKTAGPQHFSCNQNTCSSLAYSYAPYHKLVFSINGKKVESNVFKTKGFNSEYDVNISVDSISVDGSADGDVVSADLIVQVIAALIITLVIELTLLLIVKLIFKLPKKILLAGLLANLSSVPVLWLVTGLFVDSLSLLLLGEILVVIYETFFYWLYLKKKYRYYKLAILSLGLNLVSFFFTFFIRF